MFYISGFFSGEEMVRVFELLLSILIVIFSVFSCGPEKKRQEKIIVEIGNEKLTVEMLKKVTPVHQNNLLTHEQIQNYVQRWIDHELIYQEALRQGMNKNVELIQVLKKAEKDFLVDKLLDSFLSEDISISDQEIINYYEMNKDNFTRAKTEIRALHILISDENNANAIRRRILRGEDFENVAQEVSLDYNRKKRIDMGYFTSDDVVPEIAASVFNWKVGSVTRPIKSEFGYHIFKIIDKKSANTVRDYEEVKDKIIKRLITKKKEDRYKDFITSLKSKNEVKTNFEYLSELYTDTIHISQDVYPDSL